MRCKKGHEFDFPAYVIQRIRTGVVTSSNTGPDLSRYEIMIPVCPVCQLPLAVAPRAEKKSVRRKKPQKPKETEDKSQEVKDAYHGK